MAGKRVQENGKSYLCLFVAKHKTSKTYGPATLHLSGHGKIGQIGKNWKKKEKLICLSGPRPHQRSHYSLENLGHHTSVTTSDTCNSTVSNMASITCPQEPDTNKLVNMCKKKVCQKVLWASCPDTWAIIP